MSVQLQLATIEDLPLLENYILEFHEFEGLPRQKTTVAEMVRPLLGEGELGRIWLICNPAIPVGYIALCFGYSIEFGGRDAFVDEMYITAENRGRGIGTAALKIVQDKVESFGLKALHLEVSRHNSKAKRLYSTIGFEHRSRFCLMSWRPEIVAEHGS